MGATPNFDTNATPSSGSTSPSGTGGYSDDVSFNRGGTSSAQGQNGGNMGGNMDRTADSARRALDTGMERTQDAIGQIQTKASELTSRLIDNINMDELTQKLEQQVREHPARSLLIAVGAGFLLGKSMQK